jgi:glycerol-3-phosphate acyltransferase PlsX
MGSMEKNKKVKTTKTITIAVDLMGGDENPDTRLHTLIPMLKSHQSIVFRVFVSKSYLKIIAPRVVALNSENISFIACERSVGMAESPFSALRQKRESSLSMAIKDVATQQSDVCVTAGNTGAMVVLSKHWLNPLYDIERPVLATLLPSKSERALLLDVGATIDARADDLFNYARLGSAWQQALYGVVEPRVALLNVGLENNKGNDTVKQADVILSESDLNYIGYCEGSHLFKDYADVICCNGFVGNITLKSCEAMASFIKNESSDPAKSTLWQKIKKGMRIVEPDQYNGALLLGLDGLVIKSHGNCNARSFQAAIYQAYSMAQKPMIEKMTELLENS